MGKKQPKGLVELSHNEKFRTSMREILEESKSSQTGSGFTPMELTDLLTQGNFQMKFQNFVDEFVKQKTKQNENKKRGKL